MGGESSLLHFADKKTEYPPPTVKSSPSSSPLSESALRSTLDCAELPVKSERSNDVSPCRAGVQGAETGGGVPRMGEMRR